MATETHPQHSPIFGNAEYEQATDAVLEKATGRIRIFDQTLGKGYNSPSRVDVLRRFLLASRRNSLQVVLHDAQALDRNAPRLLNLLRSHGHSIAIHETHQSAKSVYDPFIVVDDRCFAHRFHFEEMRGAWSLDDPIECSALIDRFAEIWESSSPAVSATTLGL
ncbi:MAG TPA: hypothetical protein VHB46_10305 [Burkholderiales bacterium]|nr:hypothetical protein [Burkholderiales bacterium]